MEWEKYWNWLLSEKKFTLLVREMDEADESIGNEETIKETATTIMYTNRTRIRAIRHWNRCHFCYASLRIFPMILGNV